MGLESILRGITLLAIAALPFAGPTDMIWAHSLLAAIFIGLALVLTVSGRWSQQLPTNALVLALGICLAIAVLQLIPLPPALLTLLSPLSAQWQADLGWAPISLDPAATQLVLVKILGMIGLVLLIQSRVFAGEHRYLVFKVIAFSAGLQAMIGALSVLSAVEWGPYLSPKQFYLGRATGTFVYKNHLAAYLNLGFLACLFLLVRKPRKKVQKQQQILRVGLYRLLAGVIVIGLTMTHSRGGALSFTVMMAFYLTFTILRSTRKGESWRQRWLGPGLLVMSILLVDVLIVSQWFGIERLIERVEHTSLQAETRDDVLSELSDDLSPGYLGPLGTGIGAFEAAFPVLHEQVLNGHFHFAHNDWVESILGMGWLGAILVFGVLVWRLRGSRYVPLGKGALLLILVTVGTHAAVDFAYGSYAVLLTVLSLLAITSADSSGTQRKQVRACGKT